MTAPTNDNQSDTNSKIGRREAIIAGTGFAAAPLLSSVAQARETRAAAAPGPGPYPTNAYGSTSTTAPLKKIEIERRALGAHDILIDVLYCGVCHSDIHTARGDWGPPATPCVPGHEVVGRVIAVGNKVTKFRVGDAAGVGCMVDSCRTCEQCSSDREQNCAHGTTFTYGSQDKVSGGITYGGYSDKIVVTEHFGIRIPPGADLAATAPLLCAGITTFSPMQHWKLEKGQKVCVAGLGGLGHMAVKLGVARGADVTVITTSPSKAQSARALGAKEVIVSTDQNAMNKAANSLDLLISTIPESFPAGPYVNLLKLDGTLVNVGAMGPIEGLAGGQLVFSRRQFAGSLIGGIAETQEVVDYCAARGITADIEMIRPDQINEAFDRVVGKDVRYRFVIDMASLKN